MKILFLSQRFLLPMDTGGKIRTGKILEQLCKYHDITLISNVEYPRDEPYLGQIDSLCSKFVPVAWKEVKRYSSKFWLRLLLQTFRKYPVAVLNDYSDTLRLAVENEAGTDTYDIAVCDFVQSALMFMNLKNLPTLLFQHNVESLIAERHYRCSHNWLAKSFWWLQWRKMFNYEKKICNSFKKIIAVSEKDKETFTRLYGVNNVESIPTGVDVNYYTLQPENKNDNNNLVFCGSMDWLPNKDAIGYFIRQIMPHIVQKINGLTLTIVGRNPSPSLQKLAKSQNNIEFTGWVQDVRPYIAAAAVVIVPIRIGGGTRMKIYEAMAMGKAVISTSVGAEGLRIINGKNIIIEDDPIRFGDKIVDLLSDQRKREIIEFAASDFVRKNFAWQNVAQKFLKICEPET